MNPKDSVVMMSGRPVPVHLRKKKSRVSQDFYHFPVNSQVMKDNEVQQALLKKLEEYG